MCSKTVLFSLGYQCYSIVPPSICSFSWPCVSAKSLKNFVESLLWLGMTDTPLVSCRNHLEQLFFSHSVVSDFLLPHGEQHARFPWPSPSPRTCSNSCPLSQWCHPTNSHSVIPFSFCLHSFPALGSFLMSRLFASGGWSIGPSALVLPVNIQDWFPLELTGLISSLQSKGFSRVLFNTTVQKYQFFGAHPSLWSNCHIHTWKNHSFDYYMDICQQSNVSAF